MKNNNIRTMEFIDEDYWSRPVYKCIETGKLWKDITLGSENPELYSCGNSFDGEPDCPIKSNLKIKFINKVKEDKNSFNYQMLDRLKSDCEYYLGCGNRSKKYLYYKDEQMGKLLINDIVQKVKSGDYCYNGVGYHKYGYYIYGFDIKDKQFNHWRLDDGHCNITMDFYFKEKELKYKKSDKNASKIAQILEEDGWKTNPIL